MKKHPEASGPLPGQQGTQRRWRVGRQGPCPATTGFPLREVWQSPWQDLGGCVAWPGDRPSTALSWELRVTAPPYPSLHTPGPKNCLSAPPTATSREDLPPFPRSHCRTVYPRDSRGGGTNAGLSVPTGLSVFTKQTQTVTQASGQRGAPPASPLWFSWVCRRVSENSL